MAQYNVTLKGSKSHKSAADNYSWVLNQTRTLTDKRPKQIAYYKREPAFVVKEIPGEDSSSEEEATTSEAASSPREAPPSVVDSEGTPSVADSEVDEDVPSAEATEDADAEATEGGDLKSDSELHTMLKRELLEYAEGLGLDVSSAMTKAEIRAEVDTLR